MHHYKLYLLIVITAMIILFCNTAFSTTGDTFISSVDANALFRLLNVKYDTTKVTVNADYVSYPVAKQESGVASSITIGVFPTITEAKDAYRQYITSIQLGRSILRKQLLPGDEFTFWAGRTGKRGWPSRCLIRRYNSVLSFGYIGEFTDVVKFAQTLDHILMTADKVALKGATVHIPVVSISAPNSLPNGGIGSIHIQSTPGSLIRACNGRSGLNESHDVIFSQTDTKGPHTVQLTMATPGNVIFHENVTIRVVSKG